MELVCLVLRDKLFVNGGYMCRIRQWIRNQKLYKKMMYIMICACILVLLVCIGTEQIVYKAYNELMYKKTEQIFMSYSGQVEMQLKELNILTLTIIGDNNIQENLLAMQDVPTMSTNEREIVSEIQEQLMVHFFNTDVVSYYDIYSSDRLLIDSDRNMRKCVDMLVNQARAAKGSMVIILVEDKLYLARQVRQIIDYKFSELGVILAEMDMAKIIHESSRNYQKAGIEMCLSVFVEDTCVYSDDSKMKPLKKDGWETVGDDFVVQCTTGRNWKFVFSTPYGEILSSIQIKIFWTAFLTIVIVVAILVLCRYVLMHVFSHLNKLVLKFDDYSRGILPSEADMAEYSKREDEIGYINRRFVEMAYEHKVLEDENYQRILVQKEAEYMQLQQQIKPHFIFNTLSQIMWMAYEHGDREIANITNDLSMLIRSSISFNEKTITARKELKLIESYMRIQMIRYEGRMSFRIDVPKKMMDVLLPQMTIQPIVENAIVYAVEEMLDMCEITVKGRIENDKAIFIVEDNGPGIDVNILEKLVSGEAQAQGNGIGLLNVQQRIQMAFSDKFGLSFYRIDEKTQVWITVPYVASLGDVNNL